MRKKIFGIIICLICLSVRMMGQMVYEISNPGFAVVKYCIVKSPIFADIVVWKAPNLSYPEIKENKGVWYFCPNQSMANLTVCETPEIQADLKVYFTNSIIFARWNNPEKRNLMECKRYKE